MPEERTTQRREDGRPAAAPSENWEVRQQGGSWEVVQPTAQRRTQQPAREQRERRG